MNKTSLKKSLSLTWNWFLNSGVMMPSDGTWGVAERVLLLSKNSALDEIKDRFPAWSPHKDHIIIESRRADCCLETAYLFLLLQKVLRDGKPYRKTAENLLDYLYWKSGLPVRSGEKDLTLIGTWDWSHILRYHAIWFDDNSWMIILALKIAREYPALDRKYGMKDFALKLADTLSKDAADYLQEGYKGPEGRFKWSGNLRLPHWGSLVCMALVEAYRTTGKKSYLKFVDVYEKFLMKEKESFTVSEYGYAVMGATASYFVAKKKSSLACAKYFADKIVKVMDPVTGCLPSEHYEAPAGKALADTIYTMNWALLGLQNMKAVDPAYKKPCEKIFSLLIKIQDTTKKPHLCGCWRGMYDMEKGEWGGGDKYEGGANSIYSGWTNAPIAWACAFELLNKNIMEA